MQNFLKTLELKLQAHKKKTDKNYRNKYIFKNAIILIEQTVVL